MNTKMKSTPNKIDQRMFDCIKILLASGQTAAQIEEYLGIAPTTIYRIKQCENLQEYKNVMAAMYAKKAQRKAKKEEQEKKPDTPQPVMLEPADQGATAQPQQIVEHRQSVTVQTTYYVSQKLDAMVELLKGISAKLAFVVDELTGIKPKKEEDA